MCGADPSNGHSLKSIRVLGKQTKYRIPNLGKRPIVPIFDRHTTMPAGTAGPDDSVEATPAVACGLDADPIAIGQDLGVHCLIQDFILDGRSAS